MKKEISLAILIGLLLGLIVTYGVYRARHSFVDPDGIATASPTPSLTPLANSVLSITAPVDESVVFEPLLTLAGSTKPDSFVAIIVRDDETITTADRSGNFSAELTLQPGGNIIQIFSIDEDGEVISQEVTVIYSQDDEPTATGSAQVKAN